MWRLGGFQKSLICNLVLLSTIICRLKVLQTAVPGYMFRHYAALEKKVCKDHLIRLYSELLLFAPAIQIRHA